MYTSCLEPEKNIPLPFNSESNVLMQEWRGDLWVLLNQPAKYKTQLLKINSDYGIEVLPALPYMVASFTGCEQHLIVTGSNEKSQPFVICLDTNGQLLWEHHILDMEPCTWPMAACGPLPIIAWQEDAYKIELGRLDTELEMLIQHPSINISNPPAKLFSWKNNLWAGWTEKNNIHFIDLVKGEDRLVSTNGLAVNEFSIGHSQKGTYIGWVKGKKAYWKLPKLRSNYSIELKENFMGTFKLISGGEPLAWIQNPTYGIDDQLQWASTLLLEGSIPYVIENFVFAVAWWHQRIVVVNQSKILLLKNRP